MLQEIKIPRISDKPLFVSLEAGRPLFVVGANGSGKSALIQHLVSSNRSIQCVRISAHRQTWISSAHNAITSKIRQEIYINSESYERDFSSRWKDMMAEQKILAVLHDLLVKEDERYRRIGRHADNQDGEEAVKTATRIASPFAQINKLLALGTLAVSLERSTDGEILARHRHGGPEFSIAQMSDGERNAVILAAQVLTVKEGTVLLIDEPERHLHRSIIEPFLVALFAQREDCIFVVSTHEVSLPISNPTSRVLVTKSCRWMKEQPIGWDIHLLQESEENGGLPENIKRAILGARRNILFVEGSPNSLDQGLYNILFPSLLVVAAGNCREVRKVVNGLRKIQKCHDVQAFGLIDKDDRTPEDIAELSQDYVFVLDVCAVEALYYCSASIIAVAKRQAETLDNNLDAMIGEALHQAFLALEEESSLAEEIAGRLCERKVRRAVLSQVPPYREMHDKRDLEIKVSVDHSLYSTELSRFNEYVARKAWNSWDDLISRYPLHKSSVFPRIVRELKIPNKGYYEEAVRAQVKRNSALAKHLKQRIGEFSKQLDQPEVELAEVSAGRV